jgi:hypothetical protein
MSSDDCAEAIEMFKSLLMAIAGLCLLCEADVSGGFRFRISLRASNTFMPRSPTGQ